MRNVINHAPMATLPFSAAQGSRRFRDLFLRTWNGCRCLPDGVCVVIYHVPQFAHCGPLTYFGLNNKHNLLGCF